MRYSFVKIENRSKPSFLTVHAGVLQRLTFSFVYDEAFKLLFSKSFFFAI